MVSARNKGVGGIAAYREAYDKARFKEGLSNDLLGFQASTHHLRKSFSTEAKKRLGLAEHLRSGILGHRLRAHDGGADQTAVTYTIDDPDVAPLLKFARRHGKYLTGEIGDLFVDIDAARPDGMVSISDIVKFTGLSRSTVKRWLERHPDTAVRWVAENGAPARFISADVVDRIRSEYFDGYTLDKAAADLSVSVPVARSWLRSGRLTGRKDEVRRLWLVDRSSVDALLPERQRIAALKARAVTVTAAARLLDTGESTIYSFLKADKLELDPETDECGKKYVTRSSVEQIRVEREQGQKWTLPRRKKDMSGWTTLPETSVLLGIGVREVSDLADAGALSRRFHRGRCFISEASIRLFLVNAESPRVS
jgi:transposase